VNSIASITKMYRAELEMKLLSPQEITDGMSIEFNLNAMVEADYATKLSGYQTMIQNGIATPNQVARIEGLPTYPEGENYYVSNNHMVASELKEKKEADTEKVKADTEKVKADTEKVKVETEKSKNTPS